MKKVLIGLLALGCVSSFASTSVMCIWQGPATEYELEVGVKKDYAYVNLSRVKRFGQDNGYENIYQVFEVPTTSSDENITLNIPKLEEGTVESRIKSVQIKKGTWGPNVVVKGIDLPGRSRLKFYRCDRQFTVD
jgi:hypothetical protein